MPDDVLELVPIPEESSEFNELEELYGDDFLTRVFEFRLNSDEDSESVKLLR